MTDINHFCKAENYFSDVVSYFSDVVRHNITKPATHKITATFIGVNSNITGVLHTHIYILLFPFLNDESNAPYNIIMPNLHLKDVCLAVDESFYLWLYDEMRRQDGIVILTMDAGSFNSFKVVNGFGDLLIHNYKMCPEEKEWMNLDFESWYEKALFNNTFTFEITNPYQFRVPFPVKPLIFENVKNGSKRLKLIK